MPNQLEQLMDNIIAGNVNDIKLNKILDGMFINWNKDKPERHGLHLSDVKEPLKGVNQFCYRKHVLSASYKEVDIESGYISVSQLRVFLEGWYIHMKWQTLFKKSGRALEIENTRFDNVFGVYYTPDIISTFEELTQKDPWIIEIKSMSPSSYEKSCKTNDPLKAHIEGYKQAQLYMFFTGARHGMLLLEDKGSQNHRELSFDYDPLFVAPYVHRLNILSQLQEIHKNEGRIPKRICEDKDSNRATNCPMRDACWAEKKDRVKYLRTEERSKEQQKNASIYHEG